VIECFEPSFQPDPLAKILAGRRYTPFGLAGACRQKRIDF
jgi:hypothetical protein